MNIIIYNFFKQIFFILINFFSWAYIVLRCTAQDSQKSVKYNGDQPCNQGGGLNIFYFYFSAVGMAAGFGYISVTTYQTTGSNCPFQYNCYIRSISLLEPLQPITSGVHCGNTLPHDDWCSWLSTGCCCSTDR